MKANWPNEGCADEKKAVYIQDSADVDHKMKSCINHALYAADRKTFLLLYCILG